MNSTNEFSVTPMNQMVDLDPGETYTFSITILNPANSTENLDYKISAAPYSVTSETYDADVATMTDHTRMADWITIPEPTGTLTPNETRGIELTIQVPEDAPGGGQYAAIIVGVDNENKTHDNIGVTNVLEVASIVYAKVSGDIYHKGEVLENNVPGFSAIAPLTVSSLINNFGNMHETAEITITATNFFTGEVYVSRDLDNGVYNELIMPDTTKYISKEIGDLPLVGVVTVKQDIYYNYAISTVEKNVIICPIWFLALISLTLIAIIASIVRSVREHRKKKKLAQKEIA